MNNNYTLAYRAAFGSITNFLITYCGYKLIHTGKDNALFCPYHADTEKNRNGANCHSNDSKDVYFCYSCENMGNPYFTGSYVEATMAAMNMDRKEAIKWLNDKAGIQRNVEYDDSDVRRMFVEECHNNLINNAKSDKEYASAIRYLAGRGFIGKTLNAFRIGYSNSTELKNLNAKGISQEKMISAGILRISKKNGKPYNPFRNRVVMVADNNSLYGRDIRPEAKLKHYYSNTRKGIFNGNNTDNKDVIFIVESIFDALTIQQYINRLNKNWAVIATFGTQGIKVDALISFIKSKNPVEVIFIPDNDPWSKNGYIHAPGQRAVVAKAKKFVEANISTRILVLPEDSDPNDLSKNQVRARDFEAMVNQSLPLIQYEIFFESHYYDFSANGSKQAFLEKVKTLVLNNLDKNMLCSLIINQVSSIINMSPIEVKDYLQDDLKKKFISIYFKKLVESNMSNEDIISHLKSLG